MINEPTVWKFVNSENLVASRSYPDGRSDSCSIEDKGFQEWLAEGNTPEAADVN